MIDAYAAAPERAVGP